MEPRPPSGRERSFFSSLPRAQPRFRPRRSTGAAASGHPAAEALPLPIATPLGALSPPASPHVLDASPLPRCPGSPQRGSAAEQRLSRDAQLQNESAAAGRAWPRSSLPRCPHRHRAAGAPTAPRTCPASPVPVPLLHPLLQSAPAPCTACCALLGALGGGGLSPSAEPPLCGMGWQGRILRRGCCGKRPAASWQRPLAEPTRQEAGGEERGGVPPAAGAARPPTPPSLRGEKGAPCCRVGTCP